MLIEPANEWHLYRLWSQLHGVADPKDDDPPKDPLEQQYGYEKGLSHAVSSDARARASRSASAMEPLPGGNQAIPAARNAMAVARLNRIPSMKSVSATARTFCGQAPGESELTIDTGLKKVEGKITN